MSSTKAVFGARDLSAAATRVESLSSQNYTGRNRRSTNRRQGEDRRADVRFETESSDRRSHPGRRSTDPAPKPW